MARSRILVVDDNEVVLATLCKILELNGFEAVCASNVTDAIRHISNQHFDVLLSDLHMPGPGDGLTVISAMRHANPEAVTLLLSAFPSMSAASDAILLQMDEILVKPMNIPALVAIIRDRLAKGPSHRPVVENLATILDRTVQDSIADWYDLAILDSELMKVSMTREERCCHLPQVFDDLALRLLAYKPLGTKELKSQAAADHGVNRRRQGYTAAMLVEESRLLQVTIFHTLQKNLATIDFSVLLIGVMTIADEVDSQLAQAMRSYVAESVAEAVPV